MKIVSHDAYAKNKIFYGLAEAWLEVIKHPNLTTFMLHEPSETTFFCPDLYICLVIWQNLKGSAKLYQEVAITAMPAWFLSTMTSAAHLEVQRLIDNLKQNPCF
jgi:hypothetical protein